MAKYEGIYELELLKGNCEQEGYLASAGELGKEYFVYLLKENLGISDLNIEEYINYYNNERIQKKTKWMPPAKYREASMCT